MMLSAYLEMAFAGSLLREHEREWRSRVAASLFGWAVGWLAFFGATVYLPQLLWYLWDHYTVPYVVVLNTLAGAGWLLISWIGAEAGASPSTGEQARRPSRWLEWVAALGPPVFFLGLFTAAAMVIDLLVGRASDVAPPGGGGVGLVPAWWPADYASQACFYVLVFAGVSLLFVFRVNVNRFSMHMLYANRLTRCYLGASRRKREWGQRLRRSWGGAWTWGPGTSGAPTQADLTANHRRENEVTGFDPEDDLPLADLRPIRADGTESYRGPYPLFNTTLNLVAGRELAIQDRKGDSFVLTPDYCGSRATGYARTPTAARSARRSRSVGP
jgi:hypothetical protein